jgi:hypothetical protein
MLEKELLFLFIVVISILSFLFLILAYLVTRKTLENRNRKKVEHYKTKYSNPIFNFLIEGELPRNFHPKSALEKKALEELLSKYADILKGVEENNNLTKLAESHLRELYLKGLSSRRWSQRMNAFYHIEDFKMESLLNSIVELTEKKKISHEEIFYSLRILASFQYNQMFDYLVKKFRYLSENEYRSILIRLNGENLERFILGFHDCHKELQCAVLDVVGIEKEIRYLDFVEEIFISNSEEVKLRALKALSEIGYVKDISPFLHLCKSSIWQERMFTAKLLGSLNDLEGLPYLKNLLHDSSWWVRYQAGQSIANFSNSKEVFIGILDNTIDPYARDMALEWLGADREG